MNITLYNNFSDNNVVSKSLTVLGSVAGEIKAPSNIVHPTFILKTSSTVLTANYLHCDSFDSFYYITEKTVLNGGMVEINCKRDVLMTWNNGIRNIVSVITRQENEQINYIPDSNLPLKPYDDTKCIAFSGSELNSNSANIFSFNFVLNVAGGSGASSGGGNNSPNEGS